ncbi:putative DNA metabolism protein [Maribacter vaceletii]|uniref:Putative DNA metabolism protein n=1 Tax=Maribacter vaceletii TaxID=1206816 RepID=A0A495E8C2_9FLAO|nr:TIGR03915 family putative DNA repair protein [Maribacter vaceletii]RKR13182.1 putative DNA metabolism protein [Maribacter vaceletii]
MEETKTLIYDGSFNGFLTAVFVGFEEKRKTLNINKRTSCSNNLFIKTQIIFTDMKKAKRVWNTIQNKNSTALKNIYFTFLSEKKNIENVLYLYIKSLFNPYQAAQIGFSISEQINIEDVSLTVAKEKRYLEKTIQFKESNDGIFYINIAPDFDVLPLLSKHFRIRVNKKPWLIYDVNRNYGIYYDTHSTEIIVLDTNQIFKASQRKLKNNSAKIKVLNKYFNKNNLITLVINKLKQNKLTLNDNKLNLNRIAN